jgi:cell division protein FtsQ
MSSDYVLPGEGLPSTDPPLQSRSKLERILRRIIIIAALVLGMELVWRLGISPFMPLSKVEISGYQGVAREIILSQAGIGPQSSYISVDSRIAEKALEAMYQIESAKLVKRFPDRITIFLEGRKAAALSLTNLNSNVLPLFFDRKGVVFRVGNDGLSPSSLLALSPVLPVLSGLVFETPPVLGMRLPALFNPLLQDLERIESSSPELLSAISEIRINRRSYEGFDLTLYPVHKRVRIRMGPELTEDLLRYALLMVDVVDARDPEIAELDFRAGMASYTVKEASSE